ncbi:class II lanthipeptide, LchA2/BrtA2 family [Clostridium sporogenes]|uniref:Lantibiotic n=1 Tax=Clostridium botulinum TaxID=1491 RepID=A0A6M0T0L9_CLOBO|nr:class II lanthipeptide, LchA2/BrtA2 family [Clostridium sporogenes]NFA60705.1 hypothetical protein [Clostridium botulinum]NFI74155.1 hypothetical protein [Clostridium sporogenes]NFL71869.1 hypothetical protein [Clostridium sporogenes]NFM23951.1 hypothetical protein [Clostridium sporogenes]NFP62029.1 hypothetical protein [Clostridium sporogenes]
MKKYDNLTGFVSVEELEEICSENENGAATPTITVVTAVTKVTVSVATYAICETGACTSYC